MDVIYTCDDDGVEYGRAIGGASFTGSMPNHKEQTLPAFTGLHWGQKVIVTDLVNKQELSKVII